MNITLEVKWKWRETPGTITEYHSLRSSSLLVTRAVLIHLWGSKLKMNLIAKWTKQNTFWKFPRIYKTALMLWINLSSDLYIGFSIKLYGIRKSKRWLWKALGLNVFFRWKSPNKCLIDPQCFKSESKSHFFFH